MTVAAPARQRGGRPLAVLGGVLGLWVLGRALLWESPFPLSLPPLDETLMARGPLTVETEPEPASEAAAVSSWSGLSPAASEADETPAPPSFRIFEPAALASRGAPIDQSAMHQLMWLAAISEPGEPSVPFVPSLLAPARSDTPSGPRPASLASGPRRWSLSGWVFLRQGSSGPAAVGGAAVPSYGASQAGGVLRYHLAPGSGHQPAAHLRPTSALRNTDEAELALGLAARPLARVPVALMGEARLRQRGEGVALRPAVLAVTEFPAQSLPRGFEAETYVQAGYVGGAGATAFADGQARITAPLVRIDPGTMRAGAGVWGGAQKGAARLDIGPTAQLDVPVGGGSARLALDYRVRVAGDAAPGSGLALTLSTGF